MQAQIISLGTDATQPFELSEEVFGCDFNQDLVHQSVVTWFAGSRQGTKAQKTRSEVRGGGIKPWRQKGSGRARAGTNCSPIWRTGGVTFAAKPRDYSKKINKKMYRKAMRAILSELYRQQRLIIIDKLELSEVKTKSFKNLLQQLQIKGGLFISNELTEAVYLSARNIPNVEVITTRQINPAVLVHFDNIVITADTLNALQEAVS